MYTQCPHCQTIFNLSEEDLEPGDGRVRCGACFNPFSALEHRLDGLPGAAPTDQPANDPAVAAPEAPVATSMLTGSEWPPKDPLAQDGEYSSKDMDTDLPVAKRGGRAGPVLKAFLALTLVVGLLFQYAWFFPLDLLGRAPVAKPVMQDLYRLLGRELPRARDLSKLEMLRRDVRAHATQDDVLRVNARLVSHTDYRQPYPTLRLVLFNQNGQVIGARAFSPPEYVKSPAALKRGMPPLRPVQISLDLVAPKEAAESYEFQFL